VYNPYFPSFDLTDFLWLSDEFEGEIKFSNLGVFE